MTLPTGTLCKVFLSNLTVNSNIVENDIQTKRRKPFKVILAKKYFKNGDLVQNAEFRF
jgi:hypothetical protein